MSNRTPPRGSSRGRGRSRTPPIRGQRRRRGRADNGRTTTLAPEGRFGNPFGQRPPGWTPPTKPGKIWVGNPTEPPTEPYGRFGNPYGQRPPGWTPPTTTVNGPPSWQYTYTYDDKNEDKKPQPGDGGNDWETYDNNPGGRRRREGFDDFDDYDETDTDPIDKVGV